jgi:hypothetical protein
VLRFGQASHRQRVALISHKTQGDFKVLEQEKQPMLAAAEELRDILRTCSQQPGEGDTYSTCE